MKLSHLFIGSWKTFFYVLFLVTSPNLLFNANAQNKEASEDTILLFSLPAPEEIIDYIGQGNVSYQKDIVIPTSNPDRFIISSNKYIAVGMFLSDLAYSISFKQYGTSYKIFQAIDQIGTELNVISPEIEQVKERFMNNMENQDTLKALYFEVYEMVMMKFYENNRFNHYTLISSGIFIESLYLSLNSVDLAVQNREFKHRVWEQKMIFDHLMEMISKNLDVTTKNLLKIDLNPLADVFKRYAGNTPPETTMPRRNDKVMILGYQQPEINLDAAIPEINQVVKNIRFKWIK